MPPEFNKYEILRKIGEGAQGEVYLAKDKRLGRKVAIKSLHVDLITNTVLKERFIGEAKLLGQLSHSSIVTLYDYIVDTSGYHLIMEYLKGNQLDDYINKVSGPINEIRAINIFLQVLDGIHHIHKLNIVHRDIKPSNIIIDEKDEIKLLDFGIAKDYSNDPNLTVVGQSVGGTPMFMSPEHISNAKITVQSDIYSLGVTFWNMLTGKAPYEGLSLAKIYSKIENEELPPIEKIYPFASKKLNDIIKKATAKDPRKRYDSCLSFTRAIEDLKKLLISKTNSEKTKLDIKTEKNIDIRVKNVEDASFIINHIGHVGTEITFSENPGTKLNIQIHKDGYKSIYKEMVINEDELIEFELKKRMPAFISLILVVSYFLIKSLFKATGFLIEKKILKLNESKKNIVYENIDKASENFKNNINSVKSGILELSSFFGIILIIILIFTLTIDNSTVVNNKPDIGVDETTVTLDETTVTLDETTQEEIPVIEEAPVTEQPDEIDLEPNYPARGTVMTRGGGGCDSNGNRIDIVHDGAGGTYRKRVYDINYCPLPNSNSQRSASTSGSNTTNNSNQQQQITDFQERFEKGVHDFSTYQFSGWQLLIEISGRDIEIRVYKNGNLFHTYNERGKISDLWFDSSDNTLVTNRRGWGVGKKQHRFRLDNKISYNSMTGGVLYNGTGFREITLIPN